MVPTTAACRSAYSGGVGKFLLVVLVFAALVYTVFWLIERRRAGARPTRRTPPRPQPRTLAPDDDEEFLRDLNRRRRRRGLDQPSKDRLDQPRKDRLDKPRKDRLDQPSKDRDEGKPNSDG